MRECTTEQRQIYDIMRRCVTCVKLCVFALGSLTPLMLMGHASCHYDCVIIYSSVTQFVSILNDKSVFLSHRILKF